MSNNIIDKIEDKKITNNSNIKLKENYLKFREITKYDFNKNVIKKNVGSEARTFNIINQGKPLLSPSRILKIFQEHIFWNIPKKNLIKPRLMGQLVHKFVELRVKFGVVEKLTKENLSDFSGGDYGFIENNWNEKQIDLFIEEVNLSVSKIYDYLNLKNITILECEKYVADEEYHGYIDMVAYKQYRDSNKDYKFTSGIKVPMIIDLKITTQKELSNNYIAQLSIYRHLYKNTAQCYILFYDRNSQTCRLEKASWKLLDTTFEKIDTLNKMFRG